MDDKIPDKYESQWIPYALMRTVVADMAHKWIFESVSAGVTMERGNMMLKDPKLQ